MPYPNNLLLSLTIALSCSFAFPLPISTPPNALAYSTGVIKTKDIVKTGLPISIIGLIAIITFYWFYYRFQF